MPTAPLKKKPASCHACAARGTPTPAIVTAGPKSGRPVCMTDYQRERREVLSGKKRDPDDERTDLARAEVALPPDVLKTYDAWAERLGWTRSHVMRRVLMARVGLTPFLFPYPRKGRK